ncbi:MAG: alanine--tRNA ligase [Candidatus Pacebacteria bacterium]|nr:alanine--tRNA ligase [Candidatus Paceibacterota bacterium]
MTPDQLRSKYLNFFKKHGHAIVPSAPLVPENDPTTLFTGSGMQPMVPYLLGETHPLGTRIVDSQKCFRSQDIEEVGDNRHTTFFEMLGNWSLGDYFKAEQIEWVYTFLVDEVGLDPMKLYITCFGGDKEAGVDKDTQAEEIWLKLFKKRNINPEGRISFYGSDKNWWSRAGIPKNMPLGEPGGPDSEIFYDFGSELNLHEDSPFNGEECHVNCDCGRFLEIGNSVFMAYVKTEQGFKDLKGKNIDFGGGFERILAVMDNQQDVFKTELFSPIIKQIERLSGKKYEDNLMAFRVISDHIKAATFLAADGVFPNNKEQGYFSRRLVRRSVRYGLELGIEKNFIAELVPTIASIYLNQYPELDNQKEKIKNIFEIEENKFKKAIDKGLKELSKINQFTAKTAFNLYETYGFPLELSLEEAKRMGKEIEQGIESKFIDKRAAHAQKSRTASAGMFKGGLQENSVTTTKYHTATHLLQAALRKVLGPQVEQKGSNITEKRLRFDFSFERAMTDEEKTAVEQQINQWIKESQPVSKQIMEKKKALASGVMAFFAEKYPDEVSVYSIGPEGHYLSRELCGGPHVESTEQIGEIYIQKEKSASAGVRRIYIGLKN